MANAFSLTVLFSGNLLTEVRISSMLLALLIGDMLALISHAGSVIIFEETMSNEFTEVYMIGRCLYSRIRVTKENFVCQKVVPL